MKLGRKRKKGKSLKPNFGKIHGKCFITHLDKYHSQFMFGDFHALFLQGLPDLRDFWPI